MYEMEYPPVRLYGVAELVRSLLQLEVILINLFFLMTRKLASVVVVLLAVSNGVWSIRDRGGGGGEDVKEAQHQIFLLLLHYYHAIRVALNDEVQ